MLKKVIAYMLIIVILIFNTSCGKKTDNPNAPIQIWSYDYDLDSSSYYSIGISSILSDVKFFCDENDIPLEIHRYNEKKLKYEDYLLKRNIAVANGNAIVLEDAKSLHDIGNKHADYTKLDNIENLLDQYKDKYCIPIGVAYTFMRINNDAINKYNIDIPRDVITYCEYLNIKQQMKEKGANFEQTGKEFEEIVYYHLQKNGLSLLNSDSEILTDNNSLKKAIKNAIIDLCKDYTLYEDFIFSENEDINNKSYIYDKTTNTMLADLKSLDSITRYSSFTDPNESMTNRTLVIYPNTFETPCFYLYKKITNEKVYDVANFIVNENSFYMINNGEHFFSPTFDSNKIKDIFDLNENWEYDGSYKFNADKGQKREQKICSIINSIFEVLVKNKEIVNETVKYVYYSEDYQTKIMIFMFNMAYELATYKFDYNNQEASKMIDSKIDDFIINFNIHYK